MENQKPESIRSVTRRYKQLIKNVKTKPYYTEINLTNRVNCYHCLNNHITKTRDIDAGVTPMFYICETCGITAGSSYFVDVAPNQSPTQEWYRPTLDQLLKNRRNISYLDHILNGGLDIRPIKEKENEKK